MTTLTQALEAAKIFDEQAAIGEFIACENREPAEGLFYMSFSWDGWSREEIFAEGAKYQHAQSLVYLEMLSKAVSALNQVCEDAEDFTDLALLKCAIAETMTTALAELEAMSAKVKV